MKPDADESLQIAALGHDIERAVEGSKVLKADFADFEAFKSAHALNSARILKAIMFECKAPEDMVNEVYRLVALHETGGDPRSNLLKDADSLSYFEVNLPFYFRRHGWEETLRRSVWGYQRLSPRAQSIVTGFRYSDAEPSRLLEAVLRLVR